MHLLSAERERNDSQVGSAGANRTKWAWIATCVALIAVFLIANNKLVSGEHSVVWDADGLFAPAYTLIADHARVGRILLWNPWRSAGSPDYAEPQMGATSPIMILVGAITGGTEAGFRIYYLLIWVLGGIGMLLLARHLRAPWWGAFAVSLGFLFSGFYTGHGQHTTPLYSFSLVPFMVWRLDLALRSGRYWPAVESGALWGLSSLGGYPQNTILTAGFLAMWTAGWVLFPESDQFEQPLPPKPIRSTARKAVISLLLLAVVGSAVLAAPYLAFFVEGHGYSDRVGPRPRSEAVSSMPTPFGAWSTFSSPYLTDADIWGIPRLWPQTDGTFTNVYMGVLTPILALLALLALPQSKWRWWLAVMGVFWLCCSVGDQLPVRGWLYDYLWPTRYFRNPGWFREYAMLCASVLALLAFRDIQSALRSHGSRIWRRYFLAALVVTASAIAAYVHFVSKMQVQTANYTQANWFLGILWAAALLLSLVALFPRLRRLLPILFVVVAVADGILNFQISRDTVSSNGPGLVNWRRIDKDHNPSLLLHGLDRKAVYNPFHDPYWHNKNIPLKVATFKNDDTMRNSFQMDFWDEPVLLDMSTGSNRMWFSDDVAVVPPTDEVYQAFVRRIEILRAPILVVHPPATMGQIRAGSPAGAENSAASAMIPSLAVAHRIPVSLTRYTPNHLDIVVQSPTAGWLLVTDRWAHGWKASVNQKPAQVFGGDFIFRAVHLQPGENTIRFSYRPFGFPWLLVISWGTLIAVFARSCISATRRLGSIRRADH